MSFRNRVLECLFDAANWRAIQLTFKCKDQLWDRASCKPTFFTTKEEAIKAADRAEAYERSAKRWRLVRDFIDTFQTDQTVKFKHRNNPNDNERLVYEV